MFVALWLAICVACVSVRACGWPTVGNNALRTSDIGANGSADFVVAAAAAAADHQVDPSNKSVTISSRILEVSAADCSRLLAPAAIVFCVPVRASISAPLRACLSVCLCVLSSAIASRGERAS